jgi:hypothetical protein
MKKLKNLLMDVFPEAKTQKRTCSDIGLIMPNTESLDLIKNEINTFFLGEGYSVVVKEETNELAFKKGKEAVYVIIADLHDQFYFFVVKINPKSCI